MHRIMLASMIGLAAIGAVSATGRTPAVPQAMVVQGVSTDAAAKEQGLDARSEEAIKDAAAAAVIGALQSRFEGQTVEFRMGQLQSERASLRDIALHGTGAIRLGTDAGWLPMRFDALYDTDAQTVQSPAIVLGGTDKSIATDGLPLAGLQQEVTREMGAEFASQQVDFTLGKVTVVADDGRRLVVRGDGIASFDGNDSAKATVHAVYETSTGRWKDAQYDFDVLGG